MRNRDYYRYRDSSQFSEERLKMFREHRQKNRVFFGIAMALFGLVFLLREMRILPYFSLEFSWPYILIVIGVLLGIKHNFRNNAWWILMIIGVANITPQFRIMGQPSS